MSDLIEKVSDAIAAANLAYEIKLVSLIDGVSTYHLYMEGADETLTFPSHHDALQHLIKCRRIEAARAAIEAIMEPIKGQPDVGLTVVRIDTPPDADGWCYCTPRHHPEALVEEEWKSSAQMFAKVINLNPHGLRVVSYPPQGV